MATAVDVKERLDSINGNFVKGSELLYDFLGERLKQSGWVEKTRYYEKEIDDCYLCLTSSDVCVLDGDGDDYDIASLSGSVILKILPELKKIKDMINEFKPEEAKADGQGT